jgi:thioredoxin-disulfide reductase
LQKFFIGVRIIIITTKEGGVMYDTIIIGAGPAGMTAALYAARSNLKVALLEAGIPGGQMNNTADIENYPGYALISGPELAEKMFEPLENLGVEHVFGHVQRIEDQGGSKKVITEDEVYESKTVIIATGAFHRQLNVPGEAEFNSRGVSYCAVCDGAFFRDEDLLVVGGGDSAVEEAIFLTQFAKSVTIVHRRDQLRAQKVLQDRAFANEKISFVWDSVVEAIHGDERKVTGVTFKNIKTGETSQADFGGIFIYVGLDPVSEFVADLGIRDESGWIVTDDHMKTSVAGIYAIGDVRQKDLRQITTAVGDGAIAGQEAYKYITEHE